MKHLIVGLAGAAIASGLVGLAPQAAAAESCPDAQHPIVTAYSFGDVVLGTKKSQLAKFMLTTDERCAADSAVAFVRSPSRTYRVALHDTAHIGGQVLWTGSLRIKPGNLRNLDAGTWTVRYRAATNEITDERQTNGRVQRRTRASFDAKPARSDKIVYTGTLERASWGGGRYHGIGREVRVETWSCCEEDGHTAARFTTRADGSYRVTRTFPGPDDYYLEYAGTNATAGTQTAVEHVEAG